MIDITEKERALLTRILTTEIMKRITDNNFINYALVAGLLGKLSTVIENQSVV